MMLLILLFILSASLSTKELRKIDLHKRTLDAHNFHYSPNLEGSSPSTCLLFDNIVVNADFGEVYYAKSNTSSSPNDTILAIGISSNETGFSIYSDSLTSVEGFVCDSSYCIEDDNSTFEYNSTFILLEVAKRIHLKTPISIAGGAWQLRTSAISYDFLALNRIAQVSKYGWIGLGTEAEAKRNFQDETNPMFSLLLNETTGGNGSLIFGFDPSIADIDRPLMVVSSNENWEMQMTWLSLGSLLYSEEEGQTLPLIFDLLFHGVYLPERILTRIINQMTSYNATCYVYNCVTTDISAFPPLVFGLADGRNLSLRPDAYMKQRNEGLVLETDHYTSLVFRKIENVMYYQDQIVLGWNVLANFYTFFQQVNGSNTISFYEINSATSPPPNISIDSSDSLMIDSSNSSLILIIVGIILLVLILGVAFLIFVNKKNEPKREVETMELSKVKASEITVDPQERNNLL